MASIQKIVIEKRFTSQNNGYFIAGECDTLANPLYEIMLKNENCEIPEYRKIKGGIVFRVRSKKKSSASAELKKGLESLFHISKTIHQSYLKAKAQLPRRE